MNLIGPHQDIEFDLLVSGEKNVALFYDVLPDQIIEFKIKLEFDFIEFVVGFPLRDKIQNMPHVILYRRGFELDAAELKDLVSFTDGGFVPSRERRIGEILGYSKEAVEYFISTFRIPPSTV